MEEEKEEKKKKSIKERLKELSKKQIVIVLAIVIGLIVLISILNSFNRRKLDIVEKEISFGDVKTIVISNDKKKVKLTDKEDLKYIYFILYKYSNDTNHRVVKDYTVYDKGTILISINDEYDIYLYKDRKKYYMGYKNYPSFEVRDSDYRSINSYLEK
ncbi:MAG: hypothetical protein IJI43_03650 [Bacilli bacterium]|nr:hypothetical protein [Bacilli bacterium]